MNLPEDLQRIFNVGAKIYHVKDKRMGKVSNVRREDEEIAEVSVDYGNKASADVKVYQVDEFSKLLESDTIVSNSRLGQGGGTGFWIKPRLGQPAPIIQAAKPSNPRPQPKEIINQPKDLEIGYINFKTGKFSTESKRGYTKIEYRKATQKVTLEIDEDQLRKLKELGLV